MMKTTHHNTTKATQLTPTRHKSKSPIKKCKASSGSKTRSASIRTFNSAAALSNHTTTPASHSTTSPSLATHQSQPLIKKSHRPRRQYQNTSQAFHATQPQRDMTRDPLGMGEVTSTDVQTPIPFMSWSAARSANKKMKVLLAGFNSFMGQHLYEPLGLYGLDVIPVTHESGTRHDSIRTLTLDQIREQGMPDVDFVINCSGTNIYDATSDITKNLAEDTRINTARFWSEQIRQTRSKPYAFVQMSSALYYPPSSTQIYSEDYTLPPPPLPWQTDDPAYQSQELSLPYWSRFWRNVEHEARVFKPELDARTPEQIEEYNKIYAQYFHDDKKWEVYGRMGEHTPEQQRSLSVRKDLLTNRDVRVINFRHGHLLAHHMQEHSVLQPYLDKGYLANINGHANTIHPWVHIDDAVNLLIHSLFNTKTRGAINVVAPTPATSSQLLDYMTESRRSWKNSWFGINPATVNHKMGPLVGSLFLDQRHVKSTKTPETYTYVFADIDSAIERGRYSILDSQVKAYGGDWRDHPRNRGKNYTRGYGDKERHHRGY